METKDQPVTTGFWAVFQRERAKTWPIISGILAVALFLIVGANALHDWLGAVPKIAPLDAFGLAIVIYATWQKVTAAFSPYV